MAQDLTEVGSAALARASVAGDRVPTPLQPPVVEPLRGLVVVVAGPDGTGKSTLADALIRHLPEGTPVRHIHHRPGLLPYSSGPKGPVTEPHADPPYGRLKTIVKTLYLFADFELGWLARLRPFVRDGGWVVIERGWWDIVVDPRRYRLRAPARLARALGRLIPEPDLALVLDASPDVILARKDELPAEEIERQAIAWRALPRAGRLVHLDAALAPDDLADRVIREVERRRARARACGGSGWAGLPRRSHPRWLLPRAPAASARAGLTVYHPVTLRARLGWEAARMLAGLGATRLLPAAEPPRWVEDALLARVGPDETVALARTNHRSRWIALLLARDGAPRAAVKLAGDADGRTKLAREREAIEAFGPSLPGPLRPPTIVASDGDALTFQGVRWRARTRPWRLDPEVAFALGRFARAGREDGRGGWFAHGDMAPWNLLRCEDGWVLLDWEDARDDAPPFDDLFHHLVQSHTLLGRPSARELVAGLRGRGWIGEAVRAYARGARVAQENLLPPFVEHVRRGISLFDPATREGRIAITARRRLLRAAGAA